MLTLSGIWACTHASGSISHLIAPLKGQGSWILGGVQQRHCHLAVWQDGERFPLAKHCVPCLHYGCQWWGMHSPAGPAIAASLVDALFHTSLLDNLTDWQ